MHSEGYRAQAVNPDRAQADNRALGILSRTRPCPRALDSDMAREGASPSPRTRPR